MKRPSWGVLALAAGIWITPLAGCSVEQEQPAEAPDLDVELDPGHWPEYDVNWADVDVGTQERTVEVPVVRVVEEKRQVTVPYIDINPPGARDREERMLTMELEVPHAGYELEITDVRAAQDNLWIIGHLRDSGQKADAQVVGRVSDHVVVNAPADLDIRKVVVGERPDGAINQEYRFVDSESALEQLVPDQARTIYQQSS